MTIKAWCVAFNGYFNQLKDQPQETIDSSLRFNLHRYANRFGAQIIFKPASILNPFTKYSSVAKSLQPKFRYDTQRDFRGARKYDSSDFSENFLRCLPKITILTREITKNIIFDLKPCLAWFLYPKERL